ncbi:MAG: hypothetical protein ACI4JW_03515 [Oscillospiraceae bacterium]
MKTKRIFAAMLAATVACAATVSASALDDVTPNNTTEVTANIAEPGYLSYTFTIPATVDFGELTQPDSDETAHYTYAAIEVEATELNIKSDTAVYIWLKDSESTDGQFYISQKDAEDPFKIAYDVYDTEVDDATIGSNSPINNGNPETFGYNLCNFTWAEEGTTKNATLALNQNALYGKNLFDIAGDYSGTINFHSALVDI